MPINDNNLHYIARRFNDCLGILDDHGCADHPAAAHYYARPDDVDDDDPADVEHVHFVDAGADVDLDD